MKIDWSEYRNIVFDFDGVLFDTNEIKARAFSQLFKYLGSMAEEYVYYEHFKNRGVPRQIKISRWLNYFSSIKLVTASIDDKMIENFTLQFETIMMKELIQAKPLEGVLFFLDQHARDKKYIINSAAPENEIRTILRSNKIEHYFSKVFGATCSKIDNFHMMFTNLDVTPESSLFFGDALTDLYTAKNCRVQFVGVAGDEEFKKILSENNLIHIENFNDL